MKDRTTAYATYVVNNPENYHCKKEILACERHLKGLLDDNFPYFFDVREAERVINIVNDFVIVEGDGGKKKLKTRGFQEFILGNLVGWKHKDTGYRKYREAYIQMARQNGKSFLIAALANYIATFTDYNFGRIFCTATMQEQAKIVWTEIAKFINGDHDLAQLYEITNHNLTIKSNVTGTEIRALGRDTKSVDGFRTILAIIDEYHAHPNNKMYLLMQKGQSTVNNALTCAITTAGYKILGACHRQYLFAEKVLSGMVKNESLFAYIVEVDKEDDIKDYHNWVKANPFILRNHDHSINMENVKKIKNDFNSAYEKQGEDYLDFMTKRLNMWVKAENDEFIKYSDFLECGSEISIEDMKGKKCYLGIDLSSGGDLTSICFLFPLNDGKFFAHNHSFMPKLRLAEHEQSDDTPYRLWVREGLITLTTGGFGVKTDYKFIISYIEKLIEKHQIEIVAVGYDPHNASAFISDLEFLNCDLIQISQSAKSLNDATVDFSLSVEAKTFLYNNKDDLFKWAISNAHTVKNSFGEIKVCKLTETERVDPVDALLDAWKVAFEINISNYNVNDAIDEWEKLF